MMRDADIAPEQELNFLRSFTKGNPQELGDHFRKRQEDRPATTLRDLWAEFGRLSSGAPTGPNRTAAHCCQPQ